ncbi:MAG: tetratricopeptide repeat protein [Flavobacteriales bacterium]|nr:tetratricopeptide repeat protein [Flavobacteriales bacterium]
MIRFLPLICLFTFSQAFAQDYFEQFRTALQAQDTVAQMKALKDWEAAKPNDPELFTSYFNYYFYNSRQTGIAIENHPEGEESLSIQDSVGTRWYMNDGVWFNRKKLDKGFEFIDKGIALYPDRLDMRFGKAFVYREMKDWNAFTNELIATIEYGKTIDFQWIWTKNQSLEDGVNFFMTSMQDYMMQLYFSKHDSTSVYMRAISAKILEVFPEDVKFLSNMAISYMLEEDYKSGLPYLLHAEQVDPSDFIIMNNIATAYKELKETDKAIEYYQKLEKSGDERAQEYARKELEELQK